MSTPAFVRTHPVLAYFALTFAISWGGVLAVIGGWPGPTSIKAQDHPLFPLAVLATLAGPAFAGVALAAATGGLHDLKDRLFRWRLGTVWYAVALLTAPLVTLGTTLALSGLSPQFRPALTAGSNPGAMLQLAIVVGASAAACEELGWTGFALPQLLRRHTALTSGLVVGVLWSAWHLLVVLWGLGERAGDVPVPLFVLVDGLGTLPAFRVLMALVYERTQSLLLAILMHFSLTVSALAITPPVVGTYLLAQGLAGAAVIWLIAAVMFRGDARPRAQAGNVELRPSLYRRLP